ncbi:MAG TPA: dihydrodipicolinate synthase family protein [Pirellulales bacterium]|jgi:4-hydroxy-tetrahydrodipicolinate synthase|nr:dihydrodipicolinate synthase family protein [Pirellulales bacterium]
MMSSTSVTPKHAEPQKIEGMFVPNMVPLDDAGEINEAELRRYVDWLVEHGAHGLYPNGSTGEFTRFTPGERRRIVQIVCEQARGKAIVLAGAAEANVRETIHACETYLQYGARAVAIVAPYYYKLSAESVYAYFREIARQTPIDITLYNIPMFASPIDVLTLQRLAEFPRIVGIKDSSGDMAGMLRMMAAVQPARPDFVFLSGWEAALAPMLMMGCQGGTNATSGVAPEVTRKIYDLVKSGQIDAARSLQLRLVELFDALVNAADFPGGFRIGVQLRGFKLGQGRQPLSETQQCERPEIERKIAQLLSGLGLIGKSNQSY